MNVCKRMQVLLALRPTDRSVKEEKLVKVHLAVCPDCVALDRAYTEQRRLVRSAPPVELSPSQRGQLLSRIQNQRRRNKMFNKLSTVLGMAVAVVVVLTLGFYARSLLPSGVPAAPQETFILATATPTPPPVPSPIPSPVPSSVPSPVSSPVPLSPQPFELGGHVRDQSLPFADRMQHTGMNWAKLQIHYGQDPASMIAVSHDNGFKVQLTALGTPNMVSQANFEQDFADWTSQMAAAGADAIEVWNEPNIDREWMAGHISPDAYVNLLCSAYEAIKEANPDTLVISAAPAPTGFFRGDCTADGCDDEPWMKGIYDAGAANCLDYVGAHHTAGATSPSAHSGHPTGSTHHSWFFLPLTELYYDTFEGTRQIFYTEMGYASQEGVPSFPDAFAWASDTTNSEQAEWLAEAAQLSIDTEMVRAIMVWNIDFVRYGNDPQDGFAILRPDESCPACDALHEVLDPPTLPDED